MSDVTHLLAQWRDGDARAFDELVPLVYAELRQLADHYLQHERNGHTLQPTALVHEAYLRLAQQSGAGFNNRVHFYGAAATVMRRILVDHARRRLALKRGAGLAPIELNDAHSAGIDLQVDFIALDEALTPVRRPLTGAGTGRGTALLRRPHRGRNGDVAGRGSRDGETSVGLRARLAAPGTHKQNVNSDGDRFARSGEEPKVNTEHWRQVEELYAHVAGLDAAERVRVLSEKRRDEPELVREVESLIAAEPLDERFLSTPWVNGAITADAAPSLAGRTIGGFRLLESVGSGGMGVVYRAERDDPAFAQQVAIKIVTAARWHRASLKQLNAERQHLASLHHPAHRHAHRRRAHRGWACLPGDGVRRRAAHHDFCRGRHADLDTRLRLFQQVCRAVQYAHRHSIVHRDLKPANILVTPDGVPKILDFGIARLLIDPAEGIQQTTSGWLRALTPNYASPEQIRGLPASVADDVYALGVLLFELLAGRVPYETAGRPLDEVVKAVMEGPVSRPSAVLAASQPGARTSELRGDLDAIVLKAMDKDSTRRYGSAQELADDLGRHLSGQVVVAREPSFAYVVATLARRHRALVGASVVSVLAILAALGVSVVQTRRAIAERDRADQRFSDVRKLANTLIFDIHDAVRPLPGSTPVRQKIVAEALKYLEVLARDTRDDALSLELGMAYKRIAAVQGNPSETNLGDREGAVSSYRKAIAVLTPAADRSKSAAMELTRTQFSLVGTLTALGRSGEAMAVAAEAQSFAERLNAGGAGDAEAARLLGTAYFWQATLAPSGAGPGQAIPLWLKAGEVFESLLAERPDDPDRQRNVALVAKYLGEQYRRAGDLDQALVHHRRAEEIDQRRVAQAPGSRQAQLDLAQDRSSLGGLYRQKGQLKEAAVSLEQSLAVRQKLSDSDPKDDFLRGRLAYAHSLLAATYADMGNYDDALSGTREALAITESRRPLDAQGQLELAQYLVQLASLERKARQDARACEHLRQAAAALARDDLERTGAEAEAFRKTLSADLLACPAGPTPSSRQ